MVEVYLVGQDRQNRWKALPEQSLIEYYGGSPCMNLASKINGLIIRHSPRCGKAFGDRKGMEVGMEKGVEENQRLWEEWLERQREAGRSDWDDNPPPSRRE